MISDQHHCLFTHVPKTAGKSVLATFALPMLGRDYTAPLHHIRDPYGHRRLASYAGTSEFAYFKFAFVRNPWSRLTSAFFYLDAGGCNAFDAAYRERHLAQYKGDFRAFVCNLEQHVEAVHFRPQTYWICDAQAHILTDFVGRYEQLDHDFALIAAELKLTVPLPHLNASGNRNYVKHYDASSVDKVIQIYGDDIRTFGYAFGD